jgi:two-component system, NtrC family, sensor kinase
MSYPIPSNEAERLQALRHYRILDTKPEDQFDDLVQLAALICDVPISLMTLIDENRQWFKAKYGLSAQEMPRATAFCTHAIMQPDLFVIPDASQNKTFEKNPWVTGESHVRFYAGAPLASANGHLLGTICVIDREPKQLSAIQLEALRIISRLTVAQMELRRNLLELKTGMAEQSGPGASREEIKSVLGGAAADLERALGAIKKLQATTR